MPFLAPVRAMTTKPPVGAVLDRSHPLAQGMVVAVPANEGGGTRVREHVTGLWGTAKSAVTWKSSPYGPALNLPQDTTNGYVEWVGFPTLTQPAGAGFTYFVIFNAAGSGTSGFGAFFSAPEASDQMAVFFNGGLTSLVADGSNGAGATVAISANTWYAMSVKSAFSADQFLIGQTLTASTSSGGAQAAQTNLRIGWGSFGTAFNGQIAALYIWNRPLTLGDRLSLTTAPFQMFTTPAAIRRYAAPRIAASAVALAGTASADVTGAGTPTITVPLAGTAVVTFSASGSPQLTIPLTGTAAISVTGSGTTTTKATLAGAASADVTGGGSLTNTGQITLAGLASLDLTALGTPTVTLRLAGTSSADLTAGGALSTAAQLAGRATVDLSALGGTRLSIPLAGTSQISVTGSGGFAQSVRLSGAATLDLSGGGGLTASAALPASGGPTYGVASSGGSYGTTTNGGSYGAFGVTP